MRILGTEFSSVILSQIMFFKKRLKKQMPQSANTSLSQKGKSTKFQIQ